MSSASPSFATEEGPGPITEINVTPLVDIMLVLLIIFMVTASLITSPALKVDLPKGGAIRAPTQEPDVVVVVNRTGEMNYHDRRVDASTLLEALKREQRARPNVRLLIVADRKAYHGNVVRVLDMARAAGLKRLGVAIRPAAQ